MPKEPVYDTASEIPKGFHKAFCELCKGIFWHYKGAESNAKVTCGNHSDYTGRKHAIVNGAIAMLAKLTPDHSEAPNERELRIMNRLDTRLWQNAEDKKAHVYINDLEDLGGTKDTVRDPSKIYCSFCDAEVDRINSVSEKKAKIRILTETVKNSDGTFSVNERVMASQQTIHACPKCTVQVQNPVVVRRI